MLKNIVKLEHVVADKAYHFLCDNDSPLPAIKEALVKFLSYVQKVEDDAKEKALKQEQEAKKENEVNNVESQS